MSTYSGDVFLIDATTDLDGLEVLKGASLSLTDSIYIFADAQVVCSGTLKCKKLVVGCDDVGNKSGGRYDHTGNGWGYIAGGAANGLSIHVSGSVYIWGGEILRGANEAEEWYLNLLDGYCYMSGAKFQDMDIICAIAGCLELAWAEVNPNWTATNELIVSGTFIMGTSILGSYGGTTRYAVKNYGEFTMDPQSVLKLAKLCIVNSSQSLIFDDDPDTIVEDDPIDISVNTPLGGSMGRGKRLGSGGRRLAVRGAFQTDSGGTDRLTTHYLLLKALSKMNDTFAVTWDEGSINKALFRKFPVARDPTQIQEREYEFELQEVQ